MSFVRQESSVGRSRFLRYIVFIAISPVGCVPAGDQHADAAVTYPRPGEPDILWLAHCPIQYHGGWNYFSCDVIGVMGPVREITWRDNRLGTDSLHFNELGRPDERCIRGRTDFMGRRCNAITYGQDHRLAKAFGSSKYVYDAGRIVAVDSSNECTYSYSEGRHPSNLVVVYQCRGSRPSVVEIDPSGRLIATNRNNDGNGPYECEWKKIDDKTMSICTGKSFLHEITYDSRGRRTRYRRLNLPSIKTDADVTYSYVDDSYGNWVEMRTSLLWQNRPPHIEVERREITYYRKRDEHTT